MNIVQTIQKSAAWLNQGSHVWIAMYVVTTCSFIVGLLLRRARWDRYVIAPIAGVPLAFFGLIAAVLLEWTIRAMGYNRPPYLAVTGLGFIAVGFLAAWVGPRRAAAPVVARGTMILDGGSGKQKSARTIEKLRARGVEPEKIDHLTGRIDFCLKWIFGLS